MTNCSRIRTLAAATLVAASAAQIYAESLVITRDGAAAVSITPVPAKNDTLVKHATTLSGYLERMSGIAIPVNTNTVSDTGIILSLAADLPNRLEPAAQGLAEKGPEAHAIHVNGKCAVLVGNSEKAVQNAVYDILERLGCRWLLPSARWTIVPSRPGIAIPAMHSVSEPDFTFRSIWYAYGMGIDESRDALRADYDTWRDGNRLGGVAHYKIGHTYGSTVGRRQEAFREHPEYFAMNEDGTRRPFAVQGSLCYSNPDIAKFFVEDKLKELRADKAANPYAYTVSMDPNDGSVACYCEPCKALGNGSDQALHLANIVARALRAEFPDAVATMYVYASHRLPPERITAEPNVHVQVAMGFNKTQYTLPELVRLWRKKVSAVGIRDYLGVMAWDWGLPGRARAGNIKYVKEEIPEYFSWAAQSYNAEINANWGVFGPPVYVATKLLWDVEADADVIYEDFLKSAFGPASESMRELYAMWQADGNLTKQNLHLWYRKLDEAFADAKNAPAGIQERLVDMAAYLHYVKLYRDWSRAKATHSADQAYAALEPMLRFTWRIREREMVHAYALQRRLVNSGDKILRPLREHWRFNDPEAVWKLMPRPVGEEDEDLGGIPLDEPADVPKKAAEPLTDSEILAIYRRDLEETPPDQRIRTFPVALQPLEAGAEVAPPRETTGAIRFRSIWHVLVENEEHMQFTLPMSGVRFNYVLEIFDMDDERVWEAQHSVSRSNARYEQKTFDLEVKFPGPGQYRMVFNAGEDYYPSFPPGLRVQLEMSEKNHPVFRMYGPCYFYVPEGTEQIYAKTDSRLSIVNPGIGKRRDYSAADEDPELECIVIPVGDQGGKIWTLSSHTAGKGYFLNIPPYLATDRWRLLVPDRTASKP